MIRWNNDLIVHESIEDLEYEKRMIESRECQSRIYIITDSTVRDNLFDIISTAQLNIALYDDFYSEDSTKELRIYAIAKGKRNVKEALMKLVTYMIDSEGRIDKSQLKKLGGD